MGFGIPGLRFSPETPERADPFQEQPGHAQAGPRSVQAGRVQAWRSQTFLPAHQEAPCAADVHGGTTKHRCCHWDANVLNGSAGAGV